MSRMSTLLKVLRSPSTNSERHYDIIKAIWTLSLFFLFSFSFPIGLGTFVTFTTYSSLWSFDDHPWDAPDLRPVGLLRY